MEKVEFRPKLKTKTWFAYIYLILLILIFLAAAFFIDETDIYIIMTTVSVALGLIMVFSFKTIMIKSIVFSDRIIVSRHFSKDIMIAYDDIIDVGHMFIKTKKMDISLNNMKID